MQIASASKVQDTDGIWGTVVSGSPHLVSHTAQVVVQTEAMKAVGWKTGSYVADGFTYQELGKRFTYVRVDECLAVHM